MLAFSYMFPLHLSQTVGMLQAQRHSHETFRHSTRGSGIERDRYEKSANARSCVDTAQVGIPIKDVTRIPVNCLSVHRQTIFV